MSRTPGWLLPAVVIVVIMAALVTVILLAQRASGTDAPPRPAAFVAPSPLMPFARYSVSAASGGRLTLVRDAPKGSPAVAAIEVDLAPLIQVERLTPIGSGDVRVGDTVTVSGVPNAVRNFSVRRVVVQARPGSSDTDGFARSPGGFIGDETQADPIERTIIGGTVISIAGNVLSLQGSSGVLTLALANSAPLFRLEASTPSAIREGDRLASRPFAAGGAPSAVLIEPGGR